LTLQKTKPQWWKSLLIGDAEIDTDLIEGSKYLDDSLLKKVKEAKQKKKERRRQQQVQRMFTTRRLAMRTECNVL